MVCTVLQRLQHHQHHGHIAFLSLPHMQNFFSLSLSPLHSAEKSQYLSVQFSNEVLAVAKEKAMKGESGMKSALQIRASSVCG